MLNKILSAASLVLAISLSSPVFADAAKPAAQTFSTDSTVGELLANDKAKTVVSKYLPDIVNSPNLPMIENMSLKDLAAFPQAGITEQKLNEIQSDLAKVK